MAQDISRYVFPLSLWPLGVDQEMKDLSILRRLTMKPISEVMVEKTRKEFVNLSPEQAESETEKISRDQPNLLAFMMEFTQELSQEVKELAIFLFYVLYRMFEKSSKTKIDKISAEEIINCYEKNERLIQSLQGVHEKFLERIAGVQLSVQPHIMKYVVESLMEAPEDENPMTLTEEDMGYLFLLLKTVVDLLDQTFRSRFENKQERRH